MRSLCRIQSSWLSILLTVLALCHQASAAAKWDKAQREALREEIKKIDTGLEGDLGVYLKRLKDEAVFDYEADRKWYLASTVKVPVAITILKQVEKGRLSLDKELVLKQSDYVDGSGEVIWKDPGTVFTVGFLLEKMLTQSDSTATDMLIRLVGEDEVNRTVREIVGARGFGRITTLLQVRYDAYSEIHPKAKSLSNMDFILLKKVPVEERIDAILPKMGVKKTEIRAESLDDAFEAYYARGLNSSTLSAFGTLLEKLVKGEVLSPKNTALILGHMKTMTTGENRLKAGLPEDIAFAQKTGTQLRRVCNVGVIQPDVKEEQVVVTACAEKFTDQAKAEAALMKVGEAIASSGLVASRSRADKISSH